MHFPYTEEDFIAIIIAGIIYLPFVVLRLYFGNVFLLPSLDLHMMVQIFLFLLGCSQNSSHNDSLVIISDKVQIKD
ncbi:MAG: hypothetical protein ACW981_15715 [Candidatus Hodarchaeales archaeon]